MQGDRSEGSLDEAEPYFEPELQIKIFSFDSKCLGVLLWLIIEWAVDNSVDSCEPLWAERPGSDGRASVNSGPVKWLTIISST